MTLDEIRKRINAIDFEILKLLNSRMEFALRTKTLKRVITDTRREAEVIRYIQSHSQGLIQPEFCKRLFVEIIAESKRLQGEDSELIGFQGEHGSFSEVAARKFNPKLAYISCEGLRDIFRAVESGLFQFGVVPVENTIGGAVTDVNQLLVTTDLQIIGEIKLPISYCLLTLPETDPEEIRVVYSHHQVLSECRGFLDRNRLETRPYHDSAGAAKMLLQERPEASGVLAGRFCAEFYNLNVIAEGIEDHHDNQTRFLVVSLSDGPLEGNKCSIIFVAEHKAGSLFKVLKDFADAEINLTRIESMPDRRDPGNYVFFLDFFGAPGDPVVAGVLERVEAKALMYKFLGCYPADR